MSELMLCPSSSRLFALIRAAGVAHERVEDRLAALNLSLPKLGALQALHDAGEALPLGQLAERLACVKSNVTQLVDRMESDGLVRRETDPNDRRSTRAVLTPAGQALYRQGERLRAEAEEELFGALSPDEASQFETLMQKLGGRDS